MLLYLTVVITTCIDKRLNRPRLIKTETVPEMLTPVESVRDDARRLSTGSIPDVASTRFE